MPPSNPDAPEGENPCGSLYSPPVSLAALALSSSQPLVAQSDVDQQLGNVNFKTSCNEVAQRRFDRGMRYQHSYWYVNAKEVFEEAIKADPTCAMAYWGIALTLMDNPHNAIPRPNLAPGLAAITKAKEIGAKTERERDYIDALMVMYADYDKLTHAQRMRALRDAQAKVAAKYPDDDEAQIAYAITLNTSADLNDKTYAQQTKGAAILEPIAKRLPQHPGVTHYLIHLYDYPATAQKGLDAANRYAKIAPSAPHAQHMPSHIYTRVGYWKELIDSNAASVKAAKAEKSVGNYLHAQDYMVYAHLQLAQDKQARAVIDEMIKETDFKATVAAADYALAASPARYAIERGDWDAASQLAVRPSGLNFAMSISHLRPRGRRGALRQAGSRQGRHPKARGTARQAARSQGQLLVGDRRHPAAGRRCLGAARGGQVRRGAQGHECCGGRRGQDREARDHAGPDGAGARALRLHAARSRHGQGSARGLRGHQGQGAEPLPGLRRRREGS